MQYYTLKKYFKGDYEFIVFNDAKEFSDFTNGGNINIKQEIEVVCSKLNIKCINIPNENHRRVQCAAVRCADSMNYILRYQLEYPDKYLLLDSDMFLINNFNISKYSDYDCAIVLQSRHDFKTNYFWNGIYYFDMTKIKNKDMLNWNLCDGCDVGGMMKEWLKIQLGNTVAPSTDDIRWTNNNYNREGIYFIKHLWSCTWNESEIPSNLKDNKDLLEFFNNDPRNVNGKFFCEIYDNVFLHYRAGGNWKGEGMKLHNELTQRLKNIIM
jgi:hypothetical protein